MGSPMRISTHTPSLVRLFAALLLGLSGAMVLAQAPEAEETSPSQSTQAAGPVLHLELDSAIHPVVVEVIQDALEEAEAQGAELLVIELSTPGGLADSMREIFTAMLASPVPVAVYVSPAGARAASAGFFLLMASDVAAMAPSTNTGAAAVVGAGGQDIEGKMGDKVQEDAAATIRTLATRQGRNVEAAESAVLEAKSFSADEALELGLIEVIAEDLETLLDEIDGREIEKNGRTFVLRTADARVEPVEMTAIQRILAVLADPNIAYLLLTLGGLAIYVEVMNPGAIFPGVVGALALILAFFGMSVLPTNFAGVALILLALGLFVAELKIQSFGFLTAAGVVSLVLGSLMLFRTVEEVPVFRVDYEVIAGVAGTALGLVVFLFFAVVRTYRGKVTTGVEGMVSERGEARTDLDPKGKVFVHGELWEAVSDDPIPAGQTVEVVAVDGMRLKVQAVKESWPVPEVTEA